ncbi:MAG: MarR family transcriptional regulator [Desulfocapsaceae bacterium]|nr:MarR family transcriptional regulator [Desulfocapsaceae bacterium]
MSQRSTQILNTTQYFRIILRAMQAHSRFVEKQYGLSSAKLWMLRELHTNPGIKVSRLAAALAIHPSTCSNMLDKLEEKGFLYRERSRTDQRAVHLTLTEKGTHLLENAPQPAQDDISQALEQLSDESLACLTESLGELVETMNIKKAEIKDIV